MPREQLYIANGHVRITGARLTKEIMAPSAHKARTIGEEWARDNDLVYDGVETDEEHRARTATAGPPRYKAGEPIEVAIDRGDGSRREATVQHYVDGGVVLTLEDPHTIAVAELSRAEADELMAALLPLELTS